MYNHKKLSVSDAFTAAGKQLLRRPFFCVGVFLVVLIVGMVGSLLTDLLAIENLSGSVASFVTVLATAGVGLVVYSKVLELGFKKIALQLIRGDDSRYKDIVVSIHQGVRYIVGVLLFNALVIGLPIGIVWFASAGSAVDILQIANTMAGSLVLAVIIGLAGYLALIFHLFPFVLLDQNYGIVRSFHTAWSITENAIFDLVIFYGVVILLNLVGALVFGIGLLITVPITVLAQAHAYQQLSKSTFSYNQ